MDGAEQPESDYRGIADHQRKRQREPSGWRLPVFGEGYRSPGFGLHSASTLQRANSHPRMTRQIDHHAEKNTDKPKTHQFGASQTTHGLMAGHFVLL